MSNESPLYDQVRGLIDSASVADLRELQRHLRTVQRERAEAAYAHQSKICSACGSCKPLQEFYRGKKNRDGYEPICKVCREKETRARRKQQQKDNPLEYVNVDAFWAQVEKSDDCWLWRGRYDDDGYGTISVGSNTVRTHRLAFSIEHGRWPEPCCLHRCDVRGCVRPDHLFEGTIGDNVRDMFGKGRGARPPRRCRPKAGT
jgi:hypothetical protein